MVEVCGHHLHSTLTAPSIRLGRELPHELEALVLACLQKDPAARPANAAELGVAMALQRSHIGWTAEQAKASWPSCRALASQPSPQVFGATQRLLTVELRARGGGA